MTDTDVAQFSQASALDFFEQYIDCESEIGRCLNAVKGARKALKDLRKSIADNGINLESFDLARVNARKTSDEREEQDRHYRRLMAFIGKPVGAQGMFEFGDQTPEDKEAVESAKMKHAAREGYDAGRAGDKAERNPWLPGTAEFVEWIDNWTRGNGERVLAEIKPAKVGRPRKKANGVTHVEPGEQVPLDPEAHAAGVADGLADTRDSADKYPPGQDGHAAYEIGHAKGVEMAQPNA